MYFVKTRIYFGAKLGGDGAWSALQCQCAEGSAAFAAKKVATSYEIATGLYL